MRQFSRVVGRWTVFRLSSVTLALAWLGVLAAFAYSTVTVRPELASILAAAALALIAAACFLYAWREPGAA